MLLSAPAVRVTVALILTGLGCFLSGCSVRPRAVAPRPVRGASQGFPVTLTDAQGQRVVVPSPPRRIVSVTPTVTEILFALDAGGRVVAATEQCNYPPQARGLPRVGGFFTPSTEKALAAAPDLVIGQRGNPPEFIAALRRAGVPVFTISPQRLQDIYRDVLAIGRITGQTSQAAAVVAGMRERLRAIEGELASVPGGRRPSAFIFSQISPVWTAGAGTFQDDAIRAAGGRNAGASVHGFREFSTEALLAADPDYLVVSTMGGTSTLMKQQLLASPGLRRLTAVRRNRVIMLDGDELMRPGPRIVDAIEDMARVFYPDRFRAPASSSTSAR